MDLQLKASPPLNSVLPTQNPTCRTAFQLFSVNYFYFEKSIFYQDHCTFNPCVTNLITSITLLLKNGITVKPVLETTCIKRPPALRDHLSDATTLLKST